MNLSPDRRNLMFNGKKGKVLFGTRTKKFLISYNLERTNDDFFIAEKLPKKEELKKEML